MNNTPFYGLIAYKCNSVDSCMGCVQDRFNSEFQSEFMLNRAQLVEKITRILYTDKKNSYGEADHEFQIICNGFLVYNEVSGYVDNGPLELYTTATPEDEQNQEGYDAAEALGDQMALDAQNIMEEARALMEKRIADEKAEAEAAKLAAQKAAKELADKKKAEKEAAKEENERLEFERLQKKFGNQTPSTNE